MKTEAKNPGHAPSLQSRMRAVQRLLTAPEFLAIEADLRRTSFLSILGRTYTERWHSAFLAWLIDPLGSHGLGDFALRRLLVTMATMASEGSAASPSKVRELLPPAHILERSPLEVIAIRPNAANPWSMQEFTVPAPVTSKRKNMSFDVVAALRVQITSGEEDEQIWQPLLFVCENKVKAGEGEDQTKDYANWVTNPPKGDRSLERLFGTDEWSKKDSERFSALLFLAPEKNDGSRQQPADPSGSFSAMSYQDLVDEVLDQCLGHPSLTNEGRALLDGYLHNLASPFQDNPNEGRLAISPVERSAFECLVSEHKQAINDLIEAAVSPEIEEKTADTDAAGTPRVTISDLMGEKLLSSGDQVRFHLGFVDKTLPVGRKGIVIDGESFQAPSAAGKALYRQPVNGWRHFSVVAAGAERHGHPLEDLRALYRESRSLRPSGEGDADFRLYAVAVLEAHAPAFIVMDHLAERLENFRFPAWLRQTPDRKRADYAILIGQVPQEANGSISAYLKRAPEQCAFIDVSGGKVRIQLAGTDKWLSGSRGTAAALEAIDRVNPSGAYRWSDHWCIARGEFKDRRFLDVWNEVQRKLEGGEPRDPQ